MIHAYTDACVACFLSIFSPHEMFAAPGVDYDGHVGGGKDAAADAAEVVGSVDDHNICRYVAFLNPEDAQIGSRSFQLMIHSAQPFCQV